jgi:hypothetical protein
LLTIVLSLALTLVLAALFARLAGGRWLALPRRVPALWGSADGLAGLASLLLSAVALALLPWPLHPAGTQAAVGHPLPIWAALEGAFLATLIPALLAPSPLAARAAQREGQIGLAGRAVIWLALGAALWGGAGWASAHLLGRALAALAGLLALPAAVGVGPFAPEISLSPQGADEGLDEDTVRLLRLARAARAAALLAALVVASLPLGTAGGRGETSPTAAIAAPSGLLLALAVFAVIALGLGRAGAGMPRVTLPAALRWCWWRALPVAAAALVLIAL